MSLLGGVGRKIDGKSVYRKVYFVCKKHYFALPWGNFRTKMCYFLFANMCACVVSLYVGTDDFYMGSLNPLLAKKRHFGH